jgi:ADP-heptose:LPS heptosyltransferase
MFPSECFSKAFDKKEVKKVLVINLQGIGDLIMMTPLIESLKSEFRNVDILCKESNGNIFRDDNKIKTIIYNGIINSIKTVRSDYDLVICPYRAEHAGFLTAMSNAKYKIGYIYTIKLNANFKIDKNIETTNRNPRIKADNIRKLLKLKEIVSYDKPIITIKESTKIKINKLLKNYTKQNIIVFNCNNNWLSRSWPAKSWILLGKNLSKKNTNIILLIGSKNDKKINEEISDSINAGNVIDISGKLDLLETEFLLERSNIFITTDSGPLHLGIAAKTPKIISLFGSTNPRDFITKRYYNDIIWKNADGKKCPLWNYNNEPLTNNPKCMEDITVEDVLIKLKYGRRKK